MSFAISKTRRSLDFSNCSLRKCGGCEPHLVQADKLYYKRQKQSWFLDAVQIYCEAASHLSHNLMHSKIGSRGLRAFRAYLAIYVDSDDFRALVAETQKLKADLAGIRYSLHIAGKRVTVSKYNSEPDYSVRCARNIPKVQSGCGEGIPSSNTIPRRT